MDEEGGAGQRADQDKRIMVSNLKRPDDLSLRHQTTTTLSTRITSAPCRPTVPDLKVNRGTCLECLSVRCSHAEPSEGAQQESVPQPDPRRQGAGGPQQHLREAMEFHAGPNLLSSFFVLSLQ